MQSPSITGILVGLLVFAVIFGVIERVCRNVAGPAWYRRKGTRTDLAYWILLPFVTRFVTGIAIITLVVLLVVASGGNVASLKASVAAGSFPDLSVLGLGAIVRSLPFAVQLLLGLVVSDLIGYWMHRAFHRGRLWKIHAVHHSSERLDWLSSVRVHPLNTLISRTLSAGPILLLGFDPLVFAVVAPVTAFYGVLLHANVGWRFGPLRYVLASPVFHRWHHTCEEEGLEKNFAGLFPVWDVLFWTVHLPGRAATRFGVRDGSVPAGLWGQLAHPFRRRPQGSIS